MSINTFEVLAAAGTKWNFLKFQPGLVGGHCIGVDPYYLTYKSQKLGYDSQVILAGRVINDGMAAHVARKVLRHIIQNTSDVKNAKVLVMGATFKENVSDIRNSKVADIIKELESYSLQVHVTDPHAESDQLKHEYGFELTPELTNDYEAVIVSVPHKSYLDMDDSSFAEITKPNAIIADIKGVFGGKISSRAYWSL
jgi:UDP-N-acetyl-D-galactosamine dehydrogenase